MTGVGSWERERMLKLRDASSLMINNQLTYDGIRLVEVLSGCLCCQVASFFYVLICLIWFKAVKEKTI